MIFKEIKFETIEKDVVKKTHGGAYLRWGEMNAYPNYLIDLYYNSSKHGSIVKYKHQYLCGKTDDSVKLAPVNGYGDNLYDVFKSLVYQYLLYGGFVLLRKKELGRTILEVLPFHKCRIDESFSVLYYADFISSEEAFKYKPNRSVEIQEFSINKKSDDITCFVYINDILDRVYPVAEYSSALNIIELESKIIAFWNNFVNNNLTAGFLVNIFGKHGLTEEEKNKIASRFVQQFSGSSKAGKMIIEFPVNKDNETSITPIDVPDFVEKYKVLNDVVMQEIFIAHNITSPMLFGIRTEGQLGGRNELLDAFELFRNNYIISNRSNILNWLNAWTDGLFESIKIQDTLPMNIDVVQLKGILTNDEIRKALGYEPLETKSNDDVFVVQDKIVNEFKMLEGSDFESVVKTNDVEGKPTADEEYNALQSLQAIQQGTHREVKFSTIQTLTSYDVQVLKILNTNPQVELSAISVFTGLSKRALKTLLNNLINQGYIIESDNGYFVTPKGKQALANKDLLYTDVRYSYDWRAGFSDSDEKSSRDFCKKLMRESKNRESRNKLWTRADIENISLKVGWDVWDMRGGWYRLPNTEISVPYCRHIWKQHIVFVKNKE